MIRALDVLLALSALIVTAPFLLLLMLLGYLDTGAPLFRQKRVGMNEVVFSLVKFRTMRPGTASVATHLADASDITVYGRFLRKSKLDELPQLWNVLKGDMSLVGPRPCLPEQSELRECRRSRGVFSVRPGITGLAQIKKIDMSTPELLARIDSCMVSNFSLISYLYYILLTVLGKGSGDRVSH